MEELRDRIFNNKRERSKQRQSDGGKSKLVRKVELLASSLD